MNKKRIALECLIESLAYMAMALLVFLAAMLWSNTLPWWVYVIACLALSALMAWVNYLGKVYGYGFDEDDEEDSEEDDGE